MIPIHTGKFVPKYRNGQWIWNETEEKIAFQAVRERTFEEFINTGGFNFNQNIDQVKEIIFRQEFQRAGTTHDSDVILIEDIKNLVLFLAPSEMISKMFILFVHTKTVDRLLNGLIIYFEYFLKMVEYLLIQRDEVTGEKAKIRTDNSNEVMRIYAAHLSQYRLIMAREYSKIISGEGDMKPFYHVKPVVNISRSIRDQALHEAFLAFCTQVVWIAMHRRAYNTIDAEMNRLFRSEHFMLTGKDKHNFTHVERSMLYGKNHKCVNFRRQTSPLMQELSHIDKENLPLLWIGARKYRGDDLRIHQLEMEYNVPGSQLVLIDVSHGILGHPKKIYNTKLNIDWEAVRSQGYTEEYDPYRIMRQPCLDIPKLDAEKIRKFSNKYEMYYEVIDQTEKASKELVEKWIKREKIIAQMTQDAGLIMDLKARCEKELAATTTQPFVNRVSEIRDKFIKQKQKIRKN